MPDSTRRRVSRYCPTLPLRVTAFIGSARNQHIYNAVRQLMDYLESLGKVEYKRVSVLGMDRV